MKLKAQMKKREMQQFTDRILSLVVERVFFEGQKVGEKKKSPKLWGKRTDVTVWTVCSSGTWSISSR